MTHTKQREANLVAAFATALDTRLRERFAAITDHTASAPAALVALAGFLHGQSISALQATLGISHSGCVRLIDRLEHDGLVARTPSPGGREVQIALTAHGRTLAQQLQDARLAAVDDLLAELSSADREQFAGLCGVLLGLLRDAGVSPMSLCRLCAADVCGHPDTCPVTTAGATV